MMACPHCMEGPVEGRYCTFCGVLIRRELVDQARAVEINLPLIERIQAERFEAALAE